MSDTSIPTPPATPAGPAFVSRSRRRLLLGVSIGLAAVLIVGLLGWWIAGSRFWTDGAAVRVSDADARLREVVWARPEPLTGLNTPDHEYEPALSPDGDELYFVRGKAGTTPGGPAGGAHIYVCYRRAGAWTAPAPVDAVNSEHDDLGPRVTGDGRFLLFYSNRPGGFGGYDIWAAPRLAATGEGPGKWGKPFDLGAGVNSEFDEYSPDPSPDGKHLFFATNRKAASREQKNAWRATIRAGMSSDFDLWYAERDETVAAALPPAALPPMALPSTAPTTEASDNKEGDNAKGQVAAGLAFKDAVEVPGVNSPYSEGASCVSPAGDFLYFASDRPGGLGRFDIYRCRIGTDGKFGPVENIGPPINTPDNETDPQVALNGFRLYFSSDRPAGGPPGLPGGVVPVGGGGYDLLQSDSREVYSLRAGHPLPHLGWSWLVMALSLLALVPLVMFMRKWDDQRLSLIQKCLMISLLVHVLVTLVLSMRRVTTEVIHYVRQEQGLEPPVDLTLTLNGPAGRGDTAGDVTASVRQLSSNDLPAAFAPPAAATPQPLPAAAALEAPAGVRVNVPGAGVGAPADMVQVEAPKVELPKPADVAAGLPPVAPPAAATLAGPEVSLPGAPHLSAAEATPQIAPAAGAPAARAEAAPAVQSPKIDPAVAGAPAAPVAARAGSLAMPVAVRPAVPSLDLPDVGPRAALPEAAAAPAVEIARPPAAAPVASRGPEAPSAPEAPLAGARQTAEAGTPSIPVPAPAGPALPAAAAPARASLADEPAAPAGPEAGALAVARGAAGSVDVRPSGPVALPDVGVTGPRSGGGEALRSGPEAPSAVESLPDATRMGDAALRGGEPAVRPGDMAAGGNAPAARAAGESLAGAPVSAPRLAPAEVAVAAPGGPAASPLTDLPIRSALPSAGPVAARQPDVLTPAEILAGPSREGAASGPGGPAAVPDAALPTASRPAPGEAESMAAASAPMPRPGGPAAPTAAVTPGAPTDLAGAPDLGGPARGASPTRVAGVGRPDAPTPAEIAAGTARRATPGATTQPTSPDLARAGGAADPKLPAVGGASESLAGAPALPNGSAGARTALPAGPVAVAAGAPVGGVEVAGRDATPRPRTDESAPSAAAPGPLASAGPTTRPGSAAVASAGGPRDIALAVPAAPAAGATEVGVAAAPARPLDPSRAVALAGPAIPPPPGRGLGDFPAAPDVGTPRAVAPLGGLAEAAAALRAGEVAVAPGRVGPVPGAGAAPAPAPVAVPAAAPTLKGSPAGPSLASPAAAARREVLAGAVRPSDATTAGPAPVGPDGPRVALPKVAAAPPVVSPRGAAGGSAGLPGGAADGPALRVTRTDPGPRAGTVRPQDPPAGAARLASATIPGVSAVPLTGSPDPTARSLDSAAARATPRTVAGPSVAAPEVAVALPTLAAPDALFQRSVEQRKPLVEKRGGTPESEDAVARALAYLSREQEPDGRWTVFTDDGKPGNRGRHPHDMACTALATLAFLTADHTPAREGPYRSVVARSLDYLLAQQGPDGDLRGPKNLRGEGADVGNFYDQGICTMALAEAALMTGDRRYTEAALKAADFIVKNQHAQGGWRYAPGQAGDTSVLGWQILALHDAEQLGFKVPEQTKTRVEHYLTSVSHGKTKILAGYIPGREPSHAMTAEALFARLLLGDEITPAQTKEVSDYLTGNLPQAGGADFYFWYYASLSLSQMPEAAKPAGPAGGARDGAADVSAQAWRKWNGRARDTLIAMQRKGGPADGCWSQSEWAERGGRVFTTALATLTLEVYYRYLPLRPRAGSEDKPDDARQASAEVKGLRPPGAPAGPKADAAKPGQRKGGKPGRGWDDQGGHYPAVEPN